MSFQGWDGVWESFAEEVEVLEPLPGETLVARFPDKAANVVLTSHRLLVRDSAAVQSYDLSLVRDVRFETTRNPAAVVLACILFGCLGIGFLAYKFTPGGKYLIVPGLVIGPLILLAGSLALAGVESKALVIETTSGKDTMDARKITPENLARLRSRLKKARSQGA